MKDNYIGTLLIALSIGTLIFFAGAHACESYPFLAKWVGGECWFQSSPLEETISLKAEGHYLQARALHAAQSDDEVTKAAIYALAQTGSAEAVKALKEIVRTHKSTEIRKAALYALAQCAASKELISFYKTIAEKGDVLELRKTAIYAMGQVGGDEVIDILVSLAASRHHVSLRKAAVHALQNCESEPAQQALYKILAKVSDAL